MTFNKKTIKENLLQVELFGEADKKTDDNSKNTGACKNNTTVNVGGCVK